MDNDEALLAQLAQRAADMQRTADDVVDLLARLRAEHGARIAEPASPKSLITVAEAAARLSISRTKAYELVMSGQLESRTIGRLRRVVAISRGRLRPAQRMTKRSPAGRPTPFQRPDGKWQVFVEFPRKP